LGLGLITFTEEYDMKGFLTLFEETEVENSENKKEKQAKEKIHNLSFDEELALKNIDLAKEELVNIYRFDGTNGSYRYALSPEKESKMNDDRAYCIAMLAWHLQQLRRNNMVSKQKKKYRYSDYVFHN